MKKILAIITYSRSSKKGLLITDKELSQEVSQSDFENTDGSLRARYYRNLVHNYTKIINRDLEVL